MRRFTWRPSAYHGPADTRIRSARITKFATRLDPPYDTNGSVMPVSGISRVTPPTITNVWTATIVVRPVASSLPNASSRSTPTRRLRPISAR